VFNPDALLYRRSKGLQDYDERMAILLQVVQGEQFGRYFMPHAAGVAFSRNLYRWSTQIRREDGFVRLVWGLGTRAVDRVGNDYPRLVALSHPLLRPEATPKAIRRYSQQFVDVIDLENNAYKTLPVHEVLNARYPILRFLAQMDEGDYLAPIRSTFLDGKPAQLVVTFEDLLRRTPFADIMRRMVQLLEKHYQSPVDTEFTVTLTNLDKPQPQVEICLLQCRPQSHLKEMTVQLPQALYPEDIIFSTHRMVPQGIVKDICYVLFVPPESYYALPTAAARSELGHAIGRLNKELEGEVFICIGPGRWGTVNPDLGVNIGYSDIYNTSALIELAGQGVGAAPEPSFGTHFFQDLVESTIYPLAIYLDDEDVAFNRKFFYETPNQLEEFMPQEAEHSDCLRLIEVGTFRPGFHINLIMDDEQGRAVAFLAPD
jgi:hypothetical protein